MIDKLEEMNNIVSKMWLYIGLTTFAYNLCETYSSVLRYSNPFSDQTSISQSHVKRSQDDNHDSESTNIASSPSKVTFDERYNYIPGFVSNLQDPSDRNENTIDSANTDDHHCIICLQSFNTSIKHEIQFILDSISSSKKNSTNMNTIENHTVITIDNNIECNQANINNRDETQDVESQNNHSDFLSLYKCANKRCSAMYHKGCWEKAMKSQLENQHSNDLKGKFDHIQLKCPHCNHINRNLSNTLKEMVHRKERLIKLRQQALRLMTRQQHQLRQQYRSRSSRNESSCMENAWLCLLLFPIVMLFMVFIIVFIIWIADHI